MIEVIPQKTKPMIVLYREGEELIAQLNGRHTMKEELSITADLIDNCVQENAHSALNQEEYNKQYNSLVERYTGLKNRYDEITEIIVQKRSGSKGCTCFWNSWSRQNILMKDTLTFCFDQNFGVWGKISECEAKFRSIRKNVIVSNAYTT
ncbi:MAG: hypothetical protein ACI3X2_12020 [Butyricicoccus porcorum]